MTWRIEEVSVNSRDGSRCLVDNVSCDFSLGQVSTIIGPNGAGKSTLLKALVGDLPLSHGRCYLNDELFDLSASSFERARSMAFLPQLSLLSFPYTVEEVVSLGRTPHSTGSQADKSIVDECLAIVEMDHYAEALYTQLSGGEKQRVQIARVLAQIWRQEDSNGSRLLILDEPTSSLDLGHQQMLMRFLKKIADDGVSVLMVLHDLNTAAYYSDHIIAMKAGHVVEQGKPDDVLQQNILKSLFDVDCEVVKHPINGKPVVLGV